MSDDSTLIKISQKGFIGTYEEVLVQAIDTKGGYTIVLAGLKAWLEFGIGLNLVADQSPAA